MMRLAFTQLTIGGKYYVVSGHSADTDSTAQRKHERGAWFMYCGQSTTIPGGATFENPSGTKQTLDISSLLDSYHFYPVEQFDVTHDTW